MLKFVEKKANQKELDRNGIRVGEISDGKNHHRALICLVKGLMVFLACYGAIFGMIEPFEISFNRTAVILSIFFISMYVAFFYYNKIVFYIGYFILFAGFVIGLVRYFLYANSGFQAIINVVFEKYSDHFKLLALRESQETITNRYVTVTIALIFAAVFLSLLLNITISGYMNIIETVLITFPLLEIPLYIGLRPPLFTLIALLSCYICVGVLQSSKHSRMSVKGLNYHEYARTKFRGKKYYAYQSNAKLNFIVLGASLFIAAVICIFSYGLYLNTDEIPGRSKIKENTDDAIKTFVQVGWTGWLDRYSSVGGLSNGRLGGVSSIRPDFETDLTVTFAPYSYQTVYLESFKGSMYHDSSWFENSYTLDESSDMVPVLVQEQIDVFDEKASMNALKDSVSSGKMWVENKGAESGKLYQPYRSLRENIKNVTEDANGRINVSEVPTGTDNRKFYGQTLEYEFSPITYEEYPVREDYTSENADYDDYVRNQCSFVPSELSEFLDSYLEENDNLGIKSPSSYDDINDYRLASAKAIYSHFLDEYPYTMSPGSTPQSKDYVRYFLETQKRGFCSHFASSGVMLLRELGIPARYVEGYCIPLALLDENAAGVDFDYNEWHSGKSFVTEEGVLTVDVNDSYAHAWIEIYLEGYGFVPFEMTPPSFEEAATPAFGGFGNIFANLTLFNLNVEGPEQNQATNQDQFGFLKLKGLISSSGMSFGPILGLLAFILLAGFFLIFGRKIYEAVRKRILYRKGMYMDLVYIKYNDFVRLLVKKGIVKPGTNFPMDICSSLTKYTAIKEMYPDFENLFKYIEKELYSKEKGTAKEYNAFCDGLNRLSKMINKFK